jgi:hypothetical protein
MKNGITRDNFSLKDLKLMKGGGIESTTIIEMNIDGAFMEIKRKQETPVVPHFDLENLVKGLKETLLISCRFMGINAVIKKPEFNLMKNQGEAIRQMQDILLEKTIVTAVHVSGQDQNEGVIISGKIQAENGSNIAINSPRLRFTSAVYGFEEQLQIDVACLEGQLYQYLHEDKKAQLEVFSDEEQAGKVIDELPLKGKAKGKE